MRMLRGIGNGLRLPVHERVLLVEAWALFLVVGVALRIVSFRRLLDVARKLLPARQTCRCPSVGRVVWLTEVAAERSSSNPTCLKRALVVWWVLRRRGVPAVLHIGVAREDGELAAHAWLEHDDEVIVGEHDRYESLLASDAIPKPELPPVAVDAR